MWWKLRAYESSKIHLTWVRLCSYFSIWVFTKQNQKKNPGVRLNLLWFRSWLWPGVESISIDMEYQKLAAIGALDIVNKLKELCHPEIISVGPAKEPKKKKEEPQKTRTKERRTQEKWNSHWDCKLLQNSLSLDETILLLAEV